MFTRATTLSCMSAVCLLAPVPLSAQSLLGFSPRASAEQHIVEQRLHAMVDATSISALHRSLTRRPHPAGSPGSRAVIALLERQLREYGFAVRRHEYEAWLSRPRSVAVSLLAPTSRRLTVSEEPLAADPSSRHPELGDGHIAYSASGDVEGPVVYGNYGLPADYEVLRQRGVLVEGAVVLVRYGRSHRAVKVQTAQEAGARAVILYSDPADDGEARGSAWPDGYWRGAGMLQRGNAKFSWFFHGDPLTPGTPAVPGARRLDPARAPTLPRIPVVALGWGEARHILSSLAGADAPTEFVGGVPGVVYHVGSGPARVRVTVAMDNGLQRIGNVVATLRGRTYPERTVLLGGHHDAWTFGGVDPGTANAALLELARVLGRMHRLGWRPERTIQIAFWDAEEFGLIGSTEHAEAFRRELAEQGVVYINTDMYMRGRFDPGGVPSLRDLVVEAARDTPADSGSVLDEWRRTLRPGARPDLKALGSGADFVPFQDYLGIPTLSLEFIGVNNYGYGTYHTNYDTRGYVERVADPGFRQGVTLTRMLGTVALRMANAEVLPFRFSHYVDKLRSALDVADTALRRHSDVPASSVATLRAQLSRLDSSAWLLETVIDRRLLRGPALDSIALTQINDLLARAEQRLTDDDGAPDRAWFRHVVHGWNIYALYDGQMFPGLHEAAAAPGGERIAHELRRIERALQRLQLTLDGTLAITRRGDS